MYKSLVREARTEFFLSALSMAEDAGASAIVTIEDKTRGRVAGGGTPEEDVVILFLERAQIQLGTTGTEALVIFDRPGGGRAEEHEFLTGCLETLRAGTRFVRLDRLTLALSMDSRLTRLLQLADVIASSTLSFIGGEQTYSPLTSPASAGYCERRLGGAEGRTQADAGHSVREPLPLAARGHGAREGRLRASAANQRPAVLLLS